MGLKFDDGGDACCPWLLPEASEKPVPLLNQSGVEEESSQIQTPKTIPHGRHNLSLLWDSLKGMDFLQIFAQTLRDMQD